MGASLDRNVYEVGGVPTDQIHSDSHILVQFAGSVEEEPEQNLGVKSLGMNAYVIHSVFIQHAPQLNLQSLVFSISVILHGLESPSILSRRSLCECQIN